MKSVSPSYDHLESLNILGVKTNTITKDELHNRIASYIQLQQKALVLNVNVNCLNLAFEQNSLRRFLNRAEIVFCDGAGVRMGARILGYHIPERITYADWIWDLAKFSEPHGYSFYFLGARPGVAEEAANNLKDRFPRMRIEGVKHGYFEKKPGSSENQAVIKEINSVRPNILIVAFGMPLQEHWLMENWVHLDVNIALTGGAVFDYVSGNLARAPMWMTSNSLEWLGRMLIEPRRLWRRYLVGNPLFLTRVLRQRLGYLSIDS